MIWWVILFFLRWWGWDGGWGIFVVDNNDKNLLELTGNWCHGVRWCVLARGYTDERESGGRDGVDSVWCLVVLFFFAKGW